MQLLSMTISTPTLQLRTIHKAVSYTAAQGTMVKLTRREDPQLTPKLKSVMRMATLCQMYVSVILLLTLTLQRQLTWKAGGAQLRLTWKLMATVTLATLVTERMLQTEHHYRH